VVPQVLLCLPPDWQQRELSQRSSSAVPENGSKGGEDQQQEQQQEQQQLLVPRRRARLQGLQQLPGFIPGGQPAPNPQAVVWQQQVRAA
jgi:hypothetical protein